MARKKKQGAGTTGNESGKDQTTERPSLGHVVRFPEPEAHGRAQMVLGDLGMSWQVYPDPKCGVAYGLLNRQLEALRQAGIPYEVVA
jgi:hypothetical protein